jgi:NADH-quinone oxidoreductase subunit E
MLSSRERARIAAEREHLGGRAAVSEALMVLQESRGWIPDDAVAEVAEALGVSTTEVESIASAYELLFRRPVGKHVVLVCDSVSCWVAGQERLLDAISARLGIKPGETTADGRFTLLPAGCLGACDRGPAMMVNAELFEDLTPERAGEILARYGAG